MVAWKYLVNASAITFEKLTCLTSTLKMDTNPRPQEVLDSYDDTHRPKRRWPLVLLSSVCSAVVVFAAGVICALLYTILRELRAERVTVDDGTEVSMLGFWSILVLSAIAGCICCVFSLSLTYMDSYTPSKSNFRRSTGRSFHVGYAVALLNGFMASLAAGWTLS
ncbi:ADP-ribosylation factor-like protein 6-interacting protein 6 [Gadus chalcogrammus]|uniref:ADP-ribosylation factor-like protein 6-interacting protein 6 n=1 Tax=Gadus chalcogrammus TaxID=1042646 RepID=UPI0024C3FAD4|nr:ADP-ribosylation factor-like protein 6-interacting protein 6 [Gadus chalcogrammus]